MFAYAKLCVHKTVMVGTNLHHLIYNMLIAIVFLHILLSVNSKKDQSRINMLNTKGLVALTEYQQLGIKVENCRNKNYQTHIPESNFTF